MLDNSVIPVCLSSCRKALGIIEGMFCLYFMDAQIGAALHTMPTELKKKLYIVST